jgi:glycerol-3-phosphate dehydrogenase (NAD(P)+)
MVAIIGTPALDPSGEDAVRITILGDGAMGTACAILLATKPEHHVSVWSAFPEQAREIAAARENTRFLPGVRIPDTVSITADASAAAGADLLVAAVPTVYLRDTLGAVRAHIPPGRPVVSIIKGIENETFRRPSQVVLEVLGQRPVVVLSGPSHAEEIARHLPATVVAASDDESLARNVQALFSTARFRVYTNTDVAGVELAAALKNVIAIAAGVCDGLDFGDNAKSALITRGLVEITRFGVALGAQRDTFSGLAGVGDLITTCISRHGRNRAVGEALGRGKRLHEILAGMKGVAEGVWTCRAVCRMAEPMGIDMPITREVYRVLFEDKSALEAVNDLMLREPKPERI